MRVLTLAFGILIFAGALAALSLARYYGYASCVLDLGVFDQVFWSMLHRGAPLSTLNPPYIERQWFGFHFSPALYLLLPIYALFPHPETLLILNIVLITSTAIPVYLIARHWTFPAWMAACWAFAVLINPFTL